MEAAMAPENAVKMKLHAYDEATLVREMGPGGPRTVSELIVVSGKGGGYNFLYERPPGPMPEFLVHEGTLLRRIGIDASHPQCTSLLYETVTEAHVVKAGVRVTIPGK